MSDAFDWLIGKYIAKAVLHTNGQVVNVTEVPFSVPLMDSGFVFSSIAVKEIQQYVKERWNVQEEISRVSIFSALNANQKAINIKSKTETALYLIRCDDGKLAVLFFTGCTIEDANEPT